MAGQEQLLQTGRNEALDISVPCAAHQVRRSLAHDVRRRRMKRLVAILALTFTHLSLYMLCFLRSFSLGMARFDAGEVARSLPEQIYHGLAVVLAWPLYAPLFKWGTPWAVRLFPGALAYIPMLLNSYIWALVITWLWRWFREKRVERAA